MADDTTAADTIREAIQKLETEKTASSAGPWTAHPYGKYWGDPNQLQDASGYPLLRGQDEPGEFLEASDAILIVTLHRTIDAQLAILRNNLGGATDIAAGRLPDEPASVDDALDLARAILGDRAE